MKKVLFFDDEPFITNYLICNLRENHGWKGDKRIDFVSTVDELFEKISNEETYDLFVLDIMAPMPSGELKKQFTQQELNELFMAGALAKTGKYYTFDGNDPDDLNVSFFPATYEEYEYNGKKYILVKNNSDPVNELSDGCTYKKGEPIWVEVSPIEWIINIETKRMISKKGLLSGIKFNNEEYDGDFSTTLMNEYIDKYMKHDMFQVLDLKHIDKRIKSLVKKK